MLASFLIFLREGLESSMIIAIMLSYLRRVGHGERIREVWYGVVAALVLATGMGIVLYVTVRAYDGTRVQTMLEGITYLVAAGVLAMMTLWMKEQSRSLGCELRERMEGALDRRSVWGLALLAFITVGREGLETVIFTIAIGFGQNPWILLLGAGAGLLVALLLARAIYGAGLRFPMRRFFQVVGTLLTLFGAGILANGIEDMQHLGWLPFGRQVLWDSGHVISTRSLVGDLLHGMLGYAQRPSLLQVTVYGTYLAVFLVLFWHEGARRPLAAR